MNRLRRLAVLTVLAALPLSIGHAAPAPRANWLAQVAITPEGGHRIGNPDAKVRLVEYASYTCPHCSAFEVEGANPLAVGFIATGKGSLELRSYLRNEVDIAATLLVHCGPVDRFKLNHSMVMRSQPTWMKFPSAAVQQRWRTGTFAARMRAIASDMHLYPLFTARGYDMPTLDRCLADEAQAERLTRENNTAEQVLGIAGTPSFIVNDRLQDAWDWKSLRPILMALTR